MTQKFDLWQFMSFPTDRHTVWSSGETFYWERSNDAHGFLCKNRNAEELFLGDDGWVWRGLDTSPNQFEAYATWTDDSRRVWGHPWVPRYVQVGQEFETSSYTLFFDKRSGNAMTPTMIGNPNVDHNGGYQPIYFVKVVEHYDTFSTEGGKPFSDVILIEVSTFDHQPFERFWFAKDWGMIQWQSLTGNAKNFAIEKNNWPQAVFARDHIITQPAIPHLYKGEVFDVPEERTKEQMTGRYTLTAKAGNRVRVRDTASTSGNVLFTLTDQALLTVLSNENKDFLIKNGGYYWLAFIDVTDTTDQVKYVAIGRTEEPAWIELTYIEPDPDEPDPDDWVEGDIPPITVGMDTDTRVKFGNFVNAVTDAMAFYDIMTDEQQILAKVALDAIADWVRNSEDPIVAPPGGKPSEGQSSIGFVIDRTELGKVNDHDLKTFLVQLNPKVLTIINDTDLVKWVLETLPDCVVFARYIWLSREDEPHILADYHDQWHLLLQVLENNGVPKNVPNLYVTLVNEPSMFYRNTTNRIPTPEVLRWDINLTQYLESKGYHHVTQMGGGKNIIPEVIANGEYDEWIRFMATRPVAAHFYTWGPLPLSDRADSPANIFDAEKARPENWPTELDTAHQFGIFIGEHLQRQAEKILGHRLTIFVLEGPQSDNIEWMQETRLTFDGRTMTAKEWFKENGWSSSPHGDSRGFDHWGGYAKSMLNMTVSQMRYLGLVWVAAHYADLGGYGGITLFMLSENPEWILNGYALWQDLKFREALVKEKISW